MTRRALHIGEIQIRWASTLERETGLIGFVGLTIEGRIRVDGLTIRRARSGGTYIAYPHRKDRLGRERPWMFPIDDEARVEIERAVAARMLELQGTGPAESQPDSRGARTRQTRRGGGGS